MKTNDEGSTLNMNQLAEVIQTAIAFKTMKRDKLGKFKDINLKEWATEAKKKHQTEVIKDKSDLVNAFFSIANRHEDLIGK